MNKEKLKYWLPFWLVMMIGVCHSQNIQFFYDESGNRISRIIVTNEINTSIADSVRLVEKNSQSYEGKKSPMISVFPNPTSAIVKIHCDNLSENEGIELYLYTSKGESLKTIKMNTQDKTIDFTDFPKGIYYLKLLTNSKSESWKIIKQ